MKILFHGTHSVDIPGHDDVQPDDVVDVSDEVGTSLLAAGYSYPTDGPPIPPANPQWSLPTAKPKKDTDQ